MKRRGEFLSFPIPRDKIEDAYECNDLKNNVTLERRKNEMLVCFMDRKRVNIEIEKIGTTLPRLLQKFQSFELKQAEVDRL